ncbi:hypothetical protein [Microvirga splendida]|uniref:Uncharacterized protein n=1 Tax=Microvirga splendida TaxID=2795727 RepID=A0ABS0Y8D5_9HYPH|nr:hypothetical protein [Microvirga splendida]MBJ6128567.1 hypothetical protein [Microvirga splendida]
MNSDEDDEEEEEQLVARPLTTSDDRLGVACQWGGLLIALGLLAYAGFFISQ